MRTLLRFFAGFGLVAALPLWARFELCSPAGQATVLVPADEPACVRTAAGDLVSDVRKITGRTLRVVTSYGQCGSRCLIIASASAPGSAQLIERFASPAIQALRNKWEAYRVMDVPAGLLVAGSDERGTMFGLYAFLEQYLGVDPLYFWTGREPGKRDTLRWVRVRIQADEPTFRYRGWFINDEDLLSEWHDGGGRRNIDYPYYQQVTAPDVLARIFEAMLRLQYNLVIPASFTDIANPAEARMIEDATRRGLFVSMHHVEPMGVSAFAFQNYWKARGRAFPFSFFTGPAAFEETWRWYVTGWARFPGVIWQLGLRGIGDRPVWASDPKAPKTDQERGKLISRAIDLQWKMIRSIDKRPSPPATTTLWMEGADLNRKGYLHFPDGVAVVFADNSPGWKMDTDFYQTPREPGRGYGIYYHHALWGSGPHLVQAVSPWKTYQIFSEAVARGSNYYAILNVSNVREFVLGLDASARMLRDFPSFNPDTYFNSWCEARFGSAAPAAERAYRGFFDSYVTGGKGTPELLDGLALHQGEKIYSGSLSKPADLAALLEKVRKQRSALENASVETGAILASLQGDDRTFFETNFVAQYKILHGILVWLGAGITAAPDRANAGLQEIRAGQALASRGQWKDWYRGDRKMNLSRAEQLTAEWAKRMENQ